MKSDLYVLGTGSDIEVIPSKVEKIGVFCGLSTHDSLKLRLLSEEMISLVRTISQNYKGSMWVENQGGEYELHMEIESIIGEKDKQNLLSVSDGENQAAKGILGKISSFFTNIAYAASGYSDYEGFDAPRPMLNVNTAYYSIVRDYIPVWSLYDYQSSLSKEEKDRQWDGLEKSILVNITDDIIIGIKNNHIKMVVKKKF